MVSKDLTVKANFEGGDGRKPFKHLVGECSRQRNSKSGSPEAEVLGVFWERPGVHCSQSRRARGAGERDAGAHRAGLVGRPKVRGRALPSVRHVTFGWL